MSEIASVPGEQAKWQQVHALALAIYQAQQRANTFRRAGDERSATGQVGTVRTLRDLMASKLREIQDLPGVQTSFSATDRFLLATDSWVTAFLSALPGAIAAIPKAIVDGLADIAAHAGAQVLGALLPWALVGLVALWFLKQKRAILA